MHRFALYWYEYDYWAEIFDSHIMKSKYANNEIFFVRAARVWQKKSRLLKIRFHLILYRQHRVRQRNLIKSTMLHHSPRTVTVIMRKNATIELLSVRIEFSFLKIWLISNILIGLESLGHLETDATSFARFRLS